ncbi:hydroxymethylpyrimidine/phosphomethylpyrimidine kinase [Phaeobacter sp.]|uniref:hydroxymethylpyrimidine/phosphomethylpyrimidine kinase n=1 Tax=Phaeobacter sp. TaxID=1902409 RepID=UPI0025F018D0|nr:hydroxymethylpyrimidine/phosphomethylpyrimidine kinase [Phaeobacter sp.]
MSAIMIIAGTDSSGGAGLTRDTATAAAFGCHVVPVVTAVTIQTDHTVQHIEPVPPGVIAAQIRAGAESHTLRAIKIGMIGRAEAAHAIAMALTECLPEVPLILDPVLRSSSGTAFLACQPLTPLIARSTLITPNLEEAAQLTQQPLSEQGDALERQARHLMRQSAQAVLIKGGHGRSDRSCDWLFTAEQTTRFDRPRHRYGRRGTGCALSTAIASSLAQKHDLLSACETAGDFVHNWIRTGRMVPYPV